jgi:putative oxidoreductase
METGVGCSFWGSRVQRLYSTFPNGPPGIGLLLLRLAVGSSLIAEPISMMLPIPPSLLWAAHILLVGVGICICIGLWTPLMGAVQGIAELAMTLYPANGYEHHLLLALLAISLAMLGPGAWSIDSLIFGRKRITI